MSHDAHRPDRDKYPVDLRAIQLGVVAGLLACVAYALVSIPSLPKLATVTLAICFGPAFVVGSFGIQRLLDLERHHLSSALGLLLNMLGAALFSAMLLVQLAIGSLAGASKVSNQFVAIWLGLDVAWDAYFAMGTICFSLAMLRHPRFGRVFAFSGIALAAGLLASHLYTFPMPPQKAGLVDLGPALGLWYLIVTIQMWRSFSWARGRASAAADSAATISDEHGMQTA